MGAIGVAPSAVVAVDNPSGLSPAVGSEAVVQTVSGQLRNRLLHNRRSAGLPITAEATTAAADLRARTACDRRDHYRPKSTAEVPYLPAARTYLIDHHSEGGC
jgi:hypothetical protein